MVKMKLLITALLITINISFSQTVIPIIDVRENNSQGIPVLIDQFVTISGVVTSANNFGSSGPGSVQDETAGISVYGSGFAGQVSIGDSVTVTSKVAEYRGLTELDFSAQGSSLTNHGPAVNMPEPLVVTIDQILNQAWNGVEEFEGMLLRINNVSINGSGNFAGNTNYPISDSTGTLELRVDQDVASLVGSPIPSGKVDVVGILGQFKFAAPYNDGYQLLPRDITDLLTENEPLIVAPVVASNITPSSFTIYFNTVRPGDTEVRYGKTQALELDTLVVDEDTTYHVIPIDNLDSLTTYYYQAASSNDNGTSISSIYSVSTSSANPTLGTVHLYFNYAVDNTVAIPGNEAMGNIDFSDKLIERINSATYSIDMAVYSFFGLSEVANAIVAAKNRGVKVRVVYDNRAVQSSMQVLLNNGIQMSQRPSMDGIMHNKFAIFDGRDTDPLNDWVWTGSWNWTTTDLTWRNSALEINDPTLASAYQVEFEEMWGSSNDTPNSSNAKFGPFKTDNTVHSFNIGGRPVELYFSPSDNTESKIINSMNTADSSIYFALLVFTSDGIYNSIFQRHAAGLRNLRGIINDINVQGSEFSNLQGLSGSEIFAFTLTGTLHHKYGLIDASVPDSDPIVITGSHNWSRSANEDNDENTLIIHDIYLANQYMQEFKRRYNELGGTTAFTIPIITSIKEESELYPSFITLEQNYPNPFNPMTTISFFMPERDFVDLSVYNLIGQKVENIFKGEVKAGKTVIDFRADDLSSGVYFYTLQTSNQTMSKKMILLK